MKNRTVYVKEIEWPVFGEAEPVLSPSLNELLGRISQCRAAMRARGLTHVVVYGDREHFGNLMYLTHFDARFEEALLVVAETGKPLLLVGNECVSHLPHSPLYMAGELRYERFQPFSLVSQPRNESRPLQTVLANEGITAQSKVGCVGWKYFSPTEMADHETAIEIPSFVVDTLRSLCGHTQVVNASDMLMSPRYGLKTVLSPFEIAHFEFVNVMASEGMKRVLLNFKEGITDFDMIRAYQYTGYPLGCHMGMKSSGNQHIGLSSPVGATLQKGQPCSTNIAYWGSNICRAGWVAASEHDLPETARGYVEHFAGRYFDACVQWLQHLQIGTKGGALHQLVHDLLPFDTFGIFLNAGHLSHFEEWVSSPIYEGSDDTIRSGMYLQLDIIPRSTNYFSSRMEDGYVVADAALRHQLQTDYPAVYDRCMRRRAFMEQVLGIALPNEVLPLSNLAALVPPYFLHARKVLSLIP